MPVAIEFVVEAVDIHGDIYWNEAWPTAVQAKVDFDDQVRFAEDGADPSIDWTEALVRVAIRRQVFDRDGFLKRAAYWYMGGGAGDPEVDSEPEAEAPAAARREYEKAFEGVAVPWVRPAEGGG